MKKHMKKIISYILIFVILVGVYFGSLTLISYIPSSFIKENVKESANYFFYNGGENKIIELKYKKVNLFNFTNALMINTAYSIDSTNPIEAFLTAKKNYIPGVTKIIHTTTSKNLQSAEKYYKVENADRNNAVQTLELFDTVNERDLYESFEYARYWHGYLVFLRPLLLIFSYEQINILIFVLVMILLFLNFYYIKNKIGLKVAIGFALSYVLVDGLFITMSLNEVTCFIISLISCLYILIQYDKIKDINKVFFVIGALTNFFDLLTNPIVTYGMPIIIYMLIKSSKENLKFKEILKLYFTTSIMWGLGYGLTWATKWIITDLILDRGIIKNALEQISYRTSGESYSIKILIKKLLKYFSKTIVIVTGIITVILCFNIKNIKNLKHIKILNVLKSMIPFIIAIFIPIVWYIVLLNHSCVHAFFTYRNLIVSIFAIFVCAINIGKTQEVMLKKED